MPRQRMVKPEFFDSESLALCSIEARLVFIGLWVTGDDYGNQKAQLARIQHRILPYDAIDPGTFLGYLCELEEVGCIKGYEIDGERYITVPNFRSYQTVRKPSSTNIPEPPEETASAKTTETIRSWRTSTPPVRHQYATSSPERKKEGKKEVVVLQQQLPKEGAEHGADAGRPAPRSARECPSCHSVMRRTQARMPGTDRAIWLCGACGEEATFDE